MNTCQAKIGSAHTSPVDQNLDARIAALKSAGCNSVCTEQKGGASLEGVPSAANAWGHKGAWRSVCPAVLNLSVCAGGERKVGPGAPRQGRAGRPFFGCSGQVDA